MEPVSSSQDKASGVRELTVARRATPQPFAARLHFIPRLLLRYPQATLVRLFRRYFEQAPGWVLLTTRGRRTGVPREVLLPCERFRDGLYVISTYGWRSDWIRNLGKDPRVEVTCAGWAIAGLAEIIEDLETKQSIVSAHPFFPPLPVALLNFLHRTLLRPLAVAFLRWWVRSRPVVVIRPAQ
jgi:deazaflavin-dependent oxidoreductase (nitroreductase family)